VTDRVPLRRQPGGAYLYDLPGISPYGEVLELQVQLAGARSQGAVPDTLILCEHAPVITLGASADAGVELPARELVESRGIEVIEVPRGGRVTYHGLGQLVGYPILDLADYGRDLRAYVTKLEEALVATLDDLGVPASPRDGDGHVGVFTSAGAKIASIGIHVSRWITTHGFALNVSCDLEPFSLFVPCGLPDVAVTSVEHETGRDVSREEASAALVARLAESLGISEFETLPGVAAS
jgi:lipoyl(octanoyl) transferase